MPHVVIIGAGIGGLAAAARLAQRGCDVTLVEASGQPGGLAAHFDLEGLRFDAGPYILLDRAGLEWALRQVQVDIESLSLLRIPKVYEASVAGSRLCISASLDDTADEFESHWPNSGKKYRAFIARMQAKYARLQPLQCSAPPRLRELFSSGVWRDLPFLLRSLKGVLASSGLPKAVLAALGVWTHVAGQPIDHAPSPLAFVPAVIHGAGAYYPREGIGVLPAALCAAAQGLGVRFRFNAKVKHIRCRSGVACGVQLSDGETIDCDVVVSNVGIGTYLRLLDEDGRRALPSRVQHALIKLPLQSPGVCAYLAVKGRAEPPYLRFCIHDEPDGCRLLVAPSVLQGAPTGDGWWPARLIAPLQHQRAEAGGETLQREFLARVLEEEWWRKNYSDVRVLATRIPLEWGSRYHLFRESMNPVMTANFMRAGRLAHRSPWISRLYLTGSATHPGQWVSFCAISGVLTADRVLADFA